MMSQLTEKVTATMQITKLCLFLKRFCLMWGTQQKSYIEDMPTWHISERFLGYYINDVCCLSSISAMFIFTNANPWYYR